VAVVLVDNQLTAPQPAAQYDLNQSTTQTGPQELRGGPPEIFVTDGINHAVASNSASLLELKPSVLQPPCQEATTYISDAAQRGSHKTKNSSFSPKAAEKGPIYRSYPPYDPRKRNKISKSDLVDYSAASGVEYLESEEGKHDGGDQNSIPPPDLTIAVRSVCHLHSSLQPPDSSVGRVTDTTGPAYDAGVDIVDRRSTNSLEIAQHHADSIPDVPRTYYLHHL
jgi:hypothetical protein